MKKRSRASGDRIKGRRRKTREPERRNPPAAMRSNSSADGVETELARLTRELQEASEQQAATSEVLQLISSAPVDLHAAFSAILEKAVGICNASFGNICRWKGDALHLMASHNAPPAYLDERRRSPISPGPQDPVGQMLRVRNPIHVADAAAERGYLEHTNLALRVAVELGGIRTFLAVPMLKENELIGAFVLNRQEVRPFTDRQIALVTNFAAQAVIAIENARLLNELRQRTDDLSQRTTDLTEALEQQTATSEVLQVISRSLGDLEPVFATMLEKAVRVCNAKFGNLFIYDGKSFRNVAMHGVPPAFIEARRRQPVIGENPTALIRRVAETKQTLHIADITELSIQENDPPLAQLADLAGARTLVIVPMLKDDVLVGAFTLARQEVRPFTDKQIELVKNFAAQAVIAIENARLLNELRQRTTDLTERTIDLTESLEQQTATSQVLQVVSSSPGDLEPVFAAMLENAVRICDASFGNIFRWEDDAMHLVAMHNTPRAFAEFRRRSPLPSGPQSAVSRAIATKTAVPSPILRQNRATLNAAILDTSQPSNLEAYGRFWLYQC
jgi:GAF domain-containing protein